jgi:hypothetical protein
MQFFICFLCDVFYGAFFYARFLCPFFMPVFYASFLSPVFYRQFFIAREHSIELQCRVGKFAQLWENGHKMPCRKNPTNGCAKIPTAGKKIPTNT